MRRVLYDIAAMIGRAIVGMIFVMRGCAKYADGIDATTKKFAHWGIPWPRGSAWFATTTELGGGVLLILGLVTSFVGLALFVLMSGTFAFVNVGHGIRLDSDGSGLVLALGALALLVAVAGPGRASLDYFFFGRRRLEVTPALV